MGATPRGWRPYKKRTQRDREKKAMAAGRDWETNTEPEAHTRET